MYEVAYLIINLQSNQFETEVEQAHFYSSSFQNLTVSCWSFNFLTAWFFLPKLYFYFWAVLAQCKLHLLSLLSAWYFLMRLHFQTFHILCCFTPLYFLFKKIINRHNLSYYFLEYLQQVLVFLVMLNFRYLIKSLQHLFPQVLFILFQYYLLI